MRSETRCTFQNETMNSLYHFAILMNLLVFSSYGETFDHLIVLIFIVPGHFDVHFRRIMLVHFSSKDRKGGAYEGKNGWKGVYFPPESAIFVFVDNMIKELFRSSYFDWAFKQLLCPPGRRYKKEKQNYFCKYCLTLYKLLWITFVPLKWLFLIGNYSCIKKRNYTSDLFKSCLGKNISVFTTVDHFSQKRQPWETSKS